MSPRWKTIALLASIATAAGPLLGSPAALAQAPLRTEGQQTIQDAVGDVQFPQGDLVTANRWLGRPHEVRGVVSRGDQRGRTHGFPTANVSVPGEILLPADGIYAGRLARGEQLLPAAISIGTNPTFQGDERRVEAYVLDFEGDLYGEHVGLAFTERLRDTLRFDSVAALVAQMDADVARTREIVGHPHG